jgi:voltage-gated potassium channel
MRIWLRSIIEDNTTPKGRVFDYIIQILILISLAAFSVDTLPNNTVETKIALDWIEYVSVVIFSVEYLLRVFVSKHPLKYIFSFYGIIDLLAVVPFYVSTSVDLRMLRAFRIFRVFRAFKLIRYNRALHRFHIAAGIVKEEVVLFLMITTIFIFLSSAGIYFFENEAQPEAFTSIFHSLWWAVVTLTTVGYGDVYPITVGGKMFTFFVLLIGIGVVTVPAGLVASSLSKAREIEEEELSKSKSENLD